ncbi:MAG: acyl--CoA ligase, partial [Desulfobacteraceae bacterium]|nr:acyl--CoA ligase [Desulfobacteraceae bacterium]
MTIKNKQRTNIVDLIKTEIAGKEDYLAVTRTIKDSITYSTLLIDVKKLSKELSEIGFASHDRIALFCEDSIEYIIMALSILDTGAVIVPISPSLSSNELETLCDRIKVKYILSEKKLEKYSLISKKYLNKLYLHEIDKDIIYSQEYREVDSPAFIRFSSGTTGESKGVLLTHN